MYVEDSVQAIGKSKWKERIRVALGWLEVGLACVGFVYLTGVILLKDLVSLPEPMMLSGLTPFVTMFTSATLFGAGAGLLKIDRWPYLMHVPLVLWLIITYLAFGLPN